MRKPITQAAMAAAILAAGLRPASGEGARHDEVLRAVKAGELRPLTEIMEIVRPRLQGDVVRVEAERKHGVWMYEFRVVGANGERSDVYVDGMTATILRVKKK